MVLGNSMNSEQGWSKVPLRSRLGSSESPLTSMHCLGAGACHWVNKIWGSLVFRMYSACIISLWSILGRLSHPSPNNHAYEALGKRVSMSLVNSILPWQHHCLPIVARSFKFWEVFGWHSLPVELSWTVIWTVQLTRKREIKSIDWTFTSGGPQLCPQFSKILVLNLSFLGGGS